MKRTAIYMRVSSDRQAKEGDSIPAQREALLKYIADRPDYVCAGEYLDDGISGTRADRDELKRLLDDIAAGKIDLIIFTKLDRWYRSIRHYTATQEVLDKYGVSWLAIWEPIYDTTTPAGRLIVNQMMSIAQFEAENTGQRIKHVFAYKIGQGEVITGKIPHGYRVENKHLVVSTEAAAVRAVFDVFDRSGSLRQAVRESSKYEGFPRSMSAVKDMLRNTMYIGRYRENENYCAPIIDQALFDRVGRALAQNIKSSCRHEYLFTGIIRCAVCGTKMAGVAFNQNPEKGYIYNRYRCFKHYRGPVPQCSNKVIISEKSLEKYLLENLEEFFDAAMLRISEAAAAAADPDAEKKRAKTERKLERLKDLYINGFLSLEEYKRDHDRLLEELSSLVAPVKRAESPVKAVELKQGINLYASLKTPEKRQFWRSVLKSIMIDENKNITVSFL